LAVAVALALAAPRAHADGTVLQGPAHEPLTTPSRLGVETDIATFDLGGQRGSYVNVAALYDWGPTDTFVLRARLPVDTLYLAGQAARTGIGDVGLRAKYRLYKDGERLLVFAGVDEQFPTGASHLGIGGGAIQVTPYVTAGFKTYKLIVYLGVGDVISLHPRSAQPADYIDPGSDHEVREDLGLTWNADKQVRLGAAVSGVTVLVPSAFGQSLLTGGGSFVYAPTPSFKLSLIAQLPIAGEHRFEEKGSFGVYYYF
jgi:hypothetical protein